MNKNYLNKYNESKMKILAIQPIAEDEKDLAKESFSHIKTKIIQRNRLCKNKFINYAENFVDTESGEETIDQRQD